jgi:hypothetical protein
MSHRLLAALVLLFVATIVVRFPARWAFAFAPRGLDCAEASGSAWHGACRGLQAGPLRLAAIEWQLHPLALLRGRLGVSLRCADPRYQGHGELELGFGGRVAARDLEATLPLDPSWLRLVPRGWSGQLQIALGQVQLVQGKPAGILGTIDLRQLRQLSPPMEFGNYTVRFAAPADANGQQHGQLADAGGPLALSGELQLGNDGQYELNGTVAARGSAAAELARSLELLGPADAAGRRPFSLAGTL